MSSIEIAEVVGCTANNVQLRMKQHGIKARGRWSGRWKPKDCQRCGAQFTPSGPAAKFCSDACRLGTAECQSCGKTFVKRLLATSRNTKGVNDNLYCSYECRWDAVRSRDEYGRYLNAAGYVVLNKNYSKRPASRGLKADGYVRLNLRGEAGRVLEHRHVMEQHLGRPLRDDETVHHINGDRADNRLENLQLRQGKHGSGARFVCLDCGSHNVEAASLT